MSFMRRRGLYCQFLEPDLQTPLPPKLTFKSPDKIVELVDRGGGFKDLAARQAFDHGVQIGRGGLYLSLTDEQYAVLKSC